MQLIYKCVLYTSLYGTFEDPTFGGSFCQESRVATVLPGFLSTIKLLNLLDGYFFWGSYISQLYDVSFSDHAPFVSNMVGTGAVQKKTMVVTMWDLF